MSDNAQSSKESDNVTD